MIKLVYELRRVEYKTGALEQPVIDIQQDSHFGFYVSYGERQVVSLVVNDH
jgi:hypothetical protein